MNRGYIKIWRKSIDNGWLSNHTLWAFWCWCLLKATHKPCKLLIGFQEVFLEPGQLVFGRKKCANELGTSEQSVRTCLQALKSTSNLTIKSTSKFSIISIVNWEAYQGDDCLDNHQINHQINQRLTSNQPSTNHIQTHKEHKKDIVTVPFDKIQALYNEILPDLPTCRFMTEKRKKHIKTCWKHEPGRTDTVEFWKELFEFISQSDFLMGRTKDPFNGCDLEWITKSSNFVKIREGKYNR